MMNVCNSSMQCRQTTSGIHLPEEWTCNLSPSVGDIGLQCWVICYHKQLQQIEHVSETAYVSCYGKGQKKVVKFGKGRKFK